MALCMKQNDRTATNSLRVSVCAAFLMHLPKVGAAWTGAATARTTTAMEPIRSLFISADRSTLSQKGTG